MLIISRKYGRMGNRLFTFAHFIANAIEYNYRVIDPAFSEYAHYFVGTASQTVSSYPSWPFKMPLPTKLKYMISKVMHEIFYLITNPIQKGKLPWQHSAMHETITISDPEVYDWKKSGYLDFVHNKYVITTGWVFWDYEDVIKHADCIREYFELVPYYRNKVNEYITKCRQNCDIVVGVHIRHGDYKRWMGGKYYFTVEQYLALIQKVNKLFPTSKVRFLVCSNEKITNQDCNNIDLYPGPGSAIEDMYALAACDYIIGPPSTFTGWASFFGKVPIYFVKNYDYIPTIQDFSVVEGLDYYKIVSETET